jgi:hypothetical protein
MQVLRLPVLEQKLVRKPYHYCLNHPSAVP